MRRISFVVAVILALGVTANAEPYKNAVGVVFTPDFSGNSPIASIQWKHFVNAGSGLDIRGGYQFNWGPDVSVLYEWNFPVKESGLSFYAGPGIHAGLVSDYEGNRNSCFGFGLTGAVGMEYVILGSRFAISLDWHPYLTWQPSIDNETGFGWCSFQVGAKYCF